MSSLLEKLPKDLPKTDPLLFSFLVIIDAAEFQVNLRGKYTGNEDHLPVFEYAVNSWNTQQIDPNEPRRLQLVQNVLCGYFRDKPDVGTTRKVYAEFPDGTATEKQHDIEYHKDFESWRLDCYNNLEQILSALFIKSKTHDRTSTGARVQTLADIFGWELTDGVINYFYVVNKSNHQLYGVGAEFNVQSPNLECCPKVDLNKIERTYLDALGFDLNNIRP